MEKYYHIYSAPLQSPLFVNDDDRRFFLNRLALCRINKEFRVFVYCLMDNHIHLLVFGEEEKIRRAFLEIKRLYSRHLKSREESIEVNMAGFDISFREIKGADDFKGVVAYILRNPYCAGVCSPTSYKWNSSFLYFNPWREQYIGIPAKEYGKRNIRYLIGTRTTIDDSYSVLDGIISPVCWCDYLKVEQVFGRSGDYFKLLGRWDVEKEEESRITGAEMNCYSDSEFLAKVKEFCTLYGVEKVNDLSMRELTNLISMSHKRWGASKKQLERTLGVSLAIINRHY